LHVQPFAVRHICFLVTVGVVSSHMLLSCPESLPWLVLCWHSSWICWENQCSHGHLGCICIRFKTAQFSGVLWLWLFSPYCSVIGWLCSLVGETVRQVSFVTIAHLTVWEPSDWLTDWLAGWLTDWQLQNLMHVAPTANTARARK
jgi:hypothetical protein